MDVLIYMIREDLEGVGIESFGHRHKIHKAIQKEIFERNANDDIQPVSNKTPPVKQPRKLKILG